MALADYRLCDVCEAKCFYDERLSYDFAEYPDTGLYNTGAWAVLCRDCAKTHKTVIVKAEDAPSRKGADTARHGQDDHAGSPAPIRSLAEFCAEAKRTGLTAETLAQALSKRPEFADCLPAAESSKAALSDDEALRLWNYEASKSGYNSHELPARFARAILARAGIGESRREPLTDHRCIDLIVDCGLYESKEPPTLEEMCSFIRTIEAEHGITPQAGKESGE